MLCRRLHRLHAEYEQSFYGLELYTGLTPALKQCSQHGRLFATLTLSDEDGVKWQITPTHWERQAQKQSLEARASPMERVRASELLAAFSSQDRWMPGLLRSR